MRGGCSMSAQPQLPSDIQGLARQVDPLSRRGFFMSSAAAAAAGYTLAAGPVRAEAITTDTAGLTAGDAKVKVEGGDMAVYFARPANVQNPPVILWGWGSSDSTNTSRTGPPAWPSSARLRARRTIISARAKTSPRSPT